MFKQGAAAIQQAVNQEPSLQQYAENISVSQTPDGLRIDVTDSDKYAMFEKAGATLTTHGQIILGRMALLVKKMPNYMAITGHTDASPAETGSKEYTNWELSADRAQSARRYLLKSGIEPERPRRVVGMADKELFTPNEPRGPKNRRISLLMIRGSHILIPDAAVRPDAAGAHDQVPADAVKPETPVESAKDAAPAEPAAAH